MAIVGTLVSEIKADISKFSSPMKQAIKVMADFGLQSGNARKILMGLAGVVGAVVGVITMATRSYMGLVKQTKYLTDLTGMSAEEASNLISISQALGVDTERLGYAFLMLSRRIIMTPEIFKKMGVSIVDTGGKSKSLTDVFYDSVDAIGKMENGAERANATFQLFGRGAIGLQSLFQRTGEQLRQIGELMGATITQKDIERLNEFNLTTSKLKDYWEALSIAIGGRVLPAISNFLQKMGLMDSAKIEDLMKTKEMINQANEVAEIQGKQRDAVAKATLGIREAFDSQTKSVLKLTKDYKKAKEEIIKDLNDLAKKHKDALDKITKQEEDLREEFAKTNLEKETDYKQSIAEEIKSHQEKLRDYKTNLNEELNMAEEINEVKVADLQMKIAEEEAFLKKHSEDRIMVQSEMNKDEIDLVKERYAREVKEAKDNFKDKLDELAKSRIEEIAQYDEQRAEIQSKLAERTEDFKESLAEIHNDTVETISKITMAQEDWVDDVITSAKATMPAFKEIENEVGKYIDDAVKIQLAGIESVQTKLATTQNVAEKLAKTTTGTTTPAGGVATMISPTIQTDFSKILTASVIQDWSRQMTSTGITLGGAIMKGIVQGIADAIEKTPFGKFLQKVGGKVGEAVAEGQIKYKEEGGGAKGWWEGVKKEFGTLFGFQRGGLVPNTGMAMVHAGEFVLPAGKFPMVNVNFYGGMSLTKEADENRLVDKIRNVLMRDFEKAARGVY